MTPLFIVMPDLVEIILVELSNETCKVAVLEMFGQYRLGESFILQKQLGCGVLRAASLREIHL